MGELYNKLEDYVYSDAYPFHEPGHKRNYYENDFLSELYKRDINRVDAFDNLFNPKGLLMDAMKRASKKYGTDETHFLVNGSTAGILAAVSAIVKRGGKMAVMRYSQRAVYNAMCVCEINPVYIYGDVDSALGVSLGVTREQVEAVVEKNSDIEAVYLTSPTYEGISSDIDDIADYLHEKHIPLIVDATYGAHFGFADFLPANACALSADIVIHSLSKTLPAPQQSALLHINGSLVDQEKIRYYLSVYQTSAPSYIILAGIDDCISFVSGENAPWQLFYDKREKLSKDIQELEFIGAFEAFTKDRFDTPEIGKMLLYSKSKHMDGRQLGEKLRKEFGIQVQMSMPAYALLAFSLCDNDEGYERLIMALRKIDYELREKDRSTKEIDSKDLGNLEFLFGVNSNPNDLGRVPVYPRPSGSDIECNIYEAFNREKESMSLNMSIGRTAGEYVYVYTCIQPIIVPGEKITKEAIALYNYFSRHGFEVSGISMDRIEVLRSIKNKESGEK